MDEKKLIDGADYITLEDAKRLKLPYFEQVAAGFPSPAAWGASSVRATITSELVLL